MILILSSNIYVFSISKLSSFMLTQEPSTWIASPRSHFKHPEFLFSAFASNKSCSSVNLFSVHLTPFNMLLITITLRLNYFCLNTLLNQHTFKRICSAYLNEHGYCGYIFTNYIKHAHITHTPTNKTNIMKQALMNP